MKKVYKGLSECKPCPHCGECDFDIDYDSYDEDSEDEYAEWWIRCDICGLCSPIGLSKKQAIEFWNKLPRKESEEE